MFVLPRYTFPGRTIILHQSSYWKLKSCRRWIYSWKFQIVATSSFQDFQQGSHRCSKRLLLFSSNQCLFNYWFFKSLSRLYALISSLLRWSSLIHTKGLQNPVPLLFGYDLSAFRIHTLASLDAQVFKKMPFSVFMPTRLLQYEGFSLSTGGLSKGLRVDGNLLK